MASYLTVTATHDGSVGNRDIRDVLRGFNPDDLSQSSPVDSPASLSTARDDSEPEGEEAEHSSPVDSPASLSTARDDSEPEGEEAEHRWLIRSGDREEEFTKKTTDAIVAAVSTLDGVSDVAVDGGYEESA